MDEGLRLPPPDEAGQLVCARFEDFLKNFSRPETEYDPGIEGYGVTSTLLK